MKNIQIVSDSYLCCNCGACNAICPKDAISFRWSELGRKYASVNYDKCVNCGMCVKICPSLNDATNGKCKDVPNFDDFISIFVGRSTDESIFRNSQSGGVVTSILKYLFIEKKIDVAIVCKMSLDNPMVAEGCVVKNFEDLLFTQKSCYTPVDMLSVLRMIENYSSVAFVGLPCHIQGLVNIQRTNRYKNIKYKLGLFCDSILCNSIQNVIFDYAKITKPNKIVWKCKYLKEKGFCYRYAPINISNQAGEIKELPSSYRFALKSFFTSPRCNICQDKLNILSDISFGDPWGMSDVDWIKGETLAICRTNIGSLILRNAYEKGYISGTYRNDYMEIVEGQVLLSRRKRASVYGKAMNLIFPDIIDNYLLTPNMRVEKHDVVWAKVSIKQFMERDKWPKKRIINKSKKVIEKTIKNRTILENIIDKIINKITYLRNYL